LNYSIVARATRVYLPDINRALKDTAKLKRAARAAKERFKLFLGKANYLL
jgi:hypothetical protein